MQMVGTGVWHWRVIGEIPGHRMMMLTSSRPWRTEETSETRQRAGKRALCSTAGHRRQFAEVCGRTKARTDSADSHQTRPYGRNRRLECTSQTFHSEAMSSAEEK